MKYEQGQFAVFEDVRSNENYQSRIRFAPQITMRELLVQDIQEPEGMSLGFAPIHIAKLPHPSAGIEEFIAILGEPVNYLRCHLLLSSASRLPTFGSEIENIYDDLMLPDKTDRHSIERLERHEKTLGRHWKEFLLHRQVIMDTLSEGLLGEILSSPYTYEKAWQQFLTKGGFRNYYSPRVVEFFLPLLVGFRMERQEEVEKQLAKLNPLEQQQLITDWANNEDGHLIVPRSNLLTTHVQTVRGINFENIGERVKVSINGATQGEVELCPYLDEPESFYYRVVPPARSVNVLFPTIRWIRHKNGKRSFNLMPLKDEVVQAALDDLDYQVPPDLHFANERFSPLLGVSSIVYFEPHLKDEWQTRYSYKDLANPYAQRYMKKHYLGYHMVGDGMQGMGPTQSMVLQLSKRRGIERTPILPAMERHFARAIAA